MAKASSRRLRAARASARVCAIGLDVGGTKIAGGLVDSRGKILETRRIPSRPGEGGDAVLQDALGVARSLHETARRRGCLTHALGVGVCELVDARGRVVSDQTIRWRGVSVRRAFARIAPAIIESDSRAAAFCEARCGAGRSFRSFLYVTVGTGIGSSLVLDGIPLAGACGCTGTIATAPMHVLDESRGVLASAVLERVASGPALAERYNQLGAVRLDCAEEVLAAAEDGNPAAVSVVDTAATCLGATIALMVNVLDPEAVIVGGGLGAAPGNYWERLRAAIRRHIWSDVHRSLPLLQSTHGGDAGFIGAALLALSR